MKESAFSELLESVKQAGGIRRGKKRASRQFHFKPTDVKKLRSTLRLSQSEFSLLIGVSIGTLQNWEQGRRRPEGPAQALLRIARKHPDILLESLKS